MFFTAQATTVARVTFGLHTAISARLGLDEIASASANTAPARTLLGRISTLLGALGARRANAHRCRDRQRTDTNV
ncbi:Hypothetical protein A7982_04425 [Minicystis rosea]|nr:Hypothetical protein A7982_04425 [Minicystis rosea]